MQQLQFLYYHYTYRIQNTMS